MSPNLPNPFAVPVEPVSTHEAEQRTQWGIAKNGPPVNPAEVESAQHAVEVMVLWDDNVLHVEHVSPPRDVVLGEEGDFVVGADVLGVSRLPVVVKTAAGLCCVLPEGATGSVTIGETRSSFEELGADGRLTPYSELAGAQLFLLPDGATARIEHRGLQFLVRPTNAGRTVTGAATIPWRRYAWIAASLAVHTLVLTMFYFLPPSSSALSLDMGTPSTRMVEYIQNANADDTPEPEWVDPAQPDEEEGDGERHDGDEGAMGTEESEVTNNRYAIERRSSEPEAMARENADEIIESSTAVGTIRTMLANWNSPTSPYGADVPNGQDPMSAIGAIMGDQIGSNFGFNGLGMRGTGRGAGGDGRGGIGLGSYGTIGHGGGRGPGQGYGGSVQLTDRGHRDRVPNIRPERARVMGQLSQEAIRRVVHRHLPEVRFCYEQGLQSNPSIEGRVTVNWIISPTGAVSSSGVTDTSLHNGNVEQCISQAVTRWTFPAPEGGGVVGVNYPFVLQMR